MCTGVMLGYEPISSHYYLACSFTLLLSVPPRGLSPPTARWMVTQLQVCSLCLGYYNKILWMRWHRPQTVSLTDLELGRPRPRGGQPGSWRGPSSWLACRHLTVCPHALFV